MEEEKKPILEKCPCCGKVTLELPIKVKEEELDRYVSCMLTGEPYHKTYSLYKGNLSITATELSDAVKEKMNLLTSKFSMLNNDAVKDLATVFLTRLFTLLPILKITVKKGGEEKSCSVQDIVTPMVDEALSHVEDKEWLETAYKKLLSEETVLGVSKNILDKVVAKHLQNCILLQDSGFDENFFEGIVQG